MALSEENSKESEKLKKLKEEIKKLNKEVKNRDEEIRQYKKRLAENNLIERWNVGKYLHDNLAQQLISAKISISLLKDKLSKENLAEVLEEILEIIDVSIKEVRDLSHDIIPTDVEKDGIAQAIDRLKIQAESQYGINCTLETDKSILDKINSRNIATNLYNITQEAIRNAVSHGKAKNIKIALIEHKEQLYLHIKDDGKGIDDLDNQNGGMGITIMKYRAEEMDGRCRIRKAKEASKYNTVVTCNIPLEAISGD